MSDDNIQVQLTADISDLTSNMEAASASVVDSFDQLQSSTAAVGESMDKDLAEAADHAKGKLEDVREEALNVGESFEKMASMMKGSMEAAGIVIAIEALKKMGEEIEKAMSHATQIENMSQVIGTTVEEFQALELAADQAGVGIEMVSRTAIRLGKDLDDARNGSGAMVLKLNELGISMADIENKSFNTASALAVIADRLRDASTATETTAAITADFGARSAMVTQALKGYHGSATDVAKVMDLIYGKTEEQVGELHAAHAAWELLTTKIAGARDQMALYAVELIRGNTERAKSVLLPDDENEPSQARAAQEAAAKADLERRKSAIDTTRAIMEDAKQGTEERVKAEAGYVNAVAELYGANTKEYAKAAEALRKEVTETNTKLQEEALKHNDKLLAYDEKQSRAREGAARKGASDLLKEWETYDKEQTKIVEGMAKGQLDAITGQIAAQQKLLNAQRQQQNISPDDYASQEIAMINEKLNAQVHYNQVVKSLTEDQALAQVKYDNDVAAASRKAALDIETTQINAAHNVEKAWESATRPIERSLDNAFKGMINGTQTFTQTVRSLFANLANDLVTGVFHHMVSEWVTGEAIKLAASQEGAAVLKALHLSNMIVAKTTAVTEATADITTKAAQAAAGAFAATAAIPYVGPVLAPAAAAEADASVMAFLSQAAFEKGGVVPNDMMARVHEEEMVLPRHISKGIQDMIQSQMGVGGNGGGGGTQHFHISTLDTKSFHDYFNKQVNRNMIVGAAKRARSSGNRF